MDYDSFSDLWSLSGFLDNWPLAIDGREWSQSAMCNSFLEDIPPDSWEKWTHPKKWTMKCCYYLNFNALQYTNLHEEYWSDRSILLPCSSFHRMRERNRSDMNIHDHLEKMLMLMFVAWKKDGFSSGYQTDRFYSCTHVHILHYPLHIHQYPRDKWERSQNWKRESHETLIR